MNRSILSIVLGVFLTAIWIHPVGAEADFKLASISAPSSMPERVDSKLDPIVLERDMNIQHKRLMNEEHSRHLIASKLTSKDITDVPDHIAQFEQKKVTATGYTAGEESTGKNPGDPLYGITFSGVDVARDTFSTIAADPKVFPIGTIMYIPGYGYGVVADTGSAIKGNIIDLYFDTVDEVFNEWGKQQVTVYVLKEGAGSFTEEELAQLNKW